MKKPALTRPILMVMLLACLPWMHANAQREEHKLTDKWFFHRGDISLDSLTEPLDSSWKEVKIPHDWAIYGPFDRENDLQCVTITQNGESTPTWKTGRTGGLPYAGVGWYIRDFDVPPCMHAELVFDGVMSHPQVYVNNKLCATWGNGYTPFHVDVTPFLNEGGAHNSLAVRVENKALSSRWYPGAGLYRNVRLVLTGDTYVQTWGMVVTTPFVSDSLASVRVITSIENPGREPLTLVTAILDSSKCVVSSKVNTLRPLDSEPFEQNLIIDNPRLWSPDEPNLYLAKTEVYCGDSLLDTYTTRFGVRTVEVVPERGLFLNGRNLKIKGVCIHHDLGALGTAVSEPAIRHRLALLKSLNCNAIRTSHNIPSPELVQLCDEYGLMVLIEAFDEWDAPKLENGYSTLFQEWAERDITNMVTRFRNNPSVIMWSVGNEIPNQASADGWRTLVRLQNLCHQLDPTRCVTCGMDQVSSVLRNGFAQAADVVGFNYRANRYEEAHRLLPQGCLLGTETASTVSSRGYYDLLAVPRWGAKNEDLQCSSYDLDACTWSNQPDLDFAASADFPWVIGQFVWTGFDYLGEPSPYDTDSWPSHSSYFGLFDLATLPKDRYYLYRSVWAPDSLTLHILPHWNWEGDEGKPVSLFVYTNYPSAELFLNGRSLGVRQKLSKEEAEARKDFDQLWLQRRFRLIWDSIPYEPGIVQAIAYDEAGQKVAETSVTTAGRPHHLKLEPATSILKADGQDLCYITVSVVDEAGHLCPRASSLIEFEVSGEGSFVASANGDATCLDSFQEQWHHAFSGQLSAIIQSSNEPGTVTFTAKSKGLLPASVSISTVEPEHQQ